MSKLFLSITLLLISFASFCQEKITLNTYKNTVGLWNSYSEKFIFEEKYNYNDINFTITNAYIQVDDVAKSLYRIIKEHPKKISGNSEVVTAECLDEQNRKCSFSIVIDKLNDISYIMIIYEKICYVYIISKKY